MFCPRCLTANDDGAFRCFQCGEPLTGAGIGAGLRPPPRRRLALAIGLGLLMVLAVAGFLLSRR